MKPTQNRLKILKPSLDFGRLRGKRSEEVWTNLLSGDVISKNSKEKYLRLIGDRTEKSYLSPIGRLSWYDDLSERLFHNYLENVHDFLLPGLSAENCARFLNGFLKKTSKPKDEYSYARNWERQIVDVDGHSIIWMKNHRESHGCGAPVWCPGLETYDREKGVVRVIDHFTKIKPDEKLAKYIEGEINN